MQASEYRNANMLAYSKTKAYKSR